MVAGGICIFRVLWMNRSIQAKIRVDLRKLELVRMSSVGLVDVVSAMGRPSGGNSLARLISSLRGQEAGCKESQGGPLHHRVLWQSATGVSPLERMSAGLI